MRKVLIVLLIMTLFFCGCQNIKKSFRHGISSMTGLNRTITLYAVDGSVIKSWHGNFMVEVSENTASWINTDNKEVKISGTFIIQQD